MKKKKILVYLSGLLLVGALAWYFFPMILFGFIITSDHLNDQDSAKADIHTYIQEKYQGNLKAHEYMYDGEASNRYLVAITEDLEQGGSYKLYYDLKKEDIVFDEFKMEHPTGNQMFQDTGIGETETENVGEEIRFYENLVYVYEKELEQARLEYKTVKIDQIEAIFERISMDLGILYNEQDAKLSRTHLTDNKG